MAVKSKIEIYEFKRDSAWHEMAFFAERSSLETCVDGVLFNIGRARFLAADPRDIDTKMTTAHIVKAQEWLLKSKTFGFKDLAFVDKMYTIIDSLSAPYNSQQLFDLYYECKNNMRPE